MTSKKHSYPGWKRLTLTECVEQGIARGLSVPQISAALEIPADEVHRIWDRLDELVGVPTRRGQAREEGEAFYTRVCREYKNDRAS